MHFSISQLLTVALAGLAVASPTRLNRRARSVVIGFRTVAKGEADHIAEWGNDFVDDDVADRYKDEKAQTGLGKYLTAKPGQWTDKWTIDPRYCVVWADADRYNSASKLWIPKEQWWPQDEAQMARYVESQGMDRHHTLRYSKIFGKEDVEQLMIPYGLFNHWSEDQGIDLEVQCFDTIEQLQQVESRTADYNRNDIKGKNGPAHPTPPTPPKPAQPKPPTPPKGPGA